jgi:hypothetical protein
MTGAISLLRAESKISFGPAPAVESTTDTGVGGFETVDYTNYTPPALPPSTTIGPCIVITLALPQPTPAPLNITTTPLDAGPVINVNGPNGSMQIPKMSGAYYAQLGGGTAIPTPFPIPGLPGVTPLFLGPGSYEVDNGPGGADVGPFTANLTVPAPAFVWTNADSDLTVTLANGVDIQWSGGDTTTNVEIQGTVSTPTQVGSFTCIVPNNGEFFVGSNVTSMLPASPTGGGPGSISLLSVSNSSSTNFSASGISLGILIYESGYTRQVVYQ